MCNILPRKSASLAVFEPLLANLVAADTKVPHGLGHAAEADGAGRGGLVLLRGSGVEPDGVVRPAETSDLWVLRAGVSGDEVVELGCVNVKYFSSWPICWYRSASSSTRAFSRCGRRLEKSSGSSSIRWLRHNRIWLGWTLNSLAIWAIVFSPLAASKATFALKAASYVFLIRESIPYLLLRYGRLKIHLYPLSSFWGVAHTSPSRLPFPRLFTLYVGRSRGARQCSDSAKYRLPRHIWSTCVQIVIFLLRLYQKADHNKSPLFHPIHPIEPNERSHHGLVLQKIGPFLLK